MDSRTKRVILERRIALLRGHIKQVGSAQNYAPDDENPENIDTNEDEGAQNYAPGFERELQKAMQELSDLEP